MQRAKFSLASVLLLFTASAALAQTNDVSPNGAGVVSLEDNFSGTASLGQGAYIDVRNMAGSGVGYRNGYTQVGAFIPLWGSDDWFIAPQARLIITDTQRVGANIGAVARRYVSDWDRIVGANLFYDYDESYLSNNYHQVGFGFETLGQWWDARGNVYLPTGGGQTNNMGPAGLDSSLYYIHNQLAVRGYDLIEQSLKGGDVEFGVPVLPTTPWLRAFGGAYFYSGDGNNPVGFRGRLDANISNDLLVGLNVTHDNVYGTNLNAVVDFRFSGFLPTRYFPQWTTQERMLTQVQRNWRITTDRYLIAKDIPVINPRDDQPYFVVHVDSNNAAAGDGTAENPYQNLPGTVPVPTDLVLVQRGQSTESTPYTGNIQLVDYARMLGEGKAHVFDGYVNYGGYSHVYNDTVLPGFSNSGLYPFLSNPAGDIVTLANHNEVSAFVMQDASNRAIFGSGTNGFHLNNLEIAGNVGGGIVLQNAIGSGAVTLDGQTINGGLIADINRNTVGGYSLAGTGAGNNAGGGIVIDTGAAGLALGVNRVSMNVNAPGTQTVGVQLTADTGNLVTQLNDVIARGNSPAVGNSTAGVILNQTGATTLSATLTDVNVSSNLGDGLRINGDGGTTGVSATNLIANSNATGRGIDVTGTNNAQMGVVLNGGSATGNANDGLRVQGGLGADLIVGVSDFALSNNGLVTAGAANVNVGTTGGATANVMLDTVAAGFVSNASNNDFGLLVNSDGAGSLAWVQAIDSNFNNAGVNAANISSTAGGRSDLNLDNTTGNSAGGDALVATTNAGILNLEVENASNFNNALGTGFAGTAIGGGVFNVAVTGSTFNNSGDSGIYLRSIGAGSVLTGQLDTVSASNNGDFGLYSSAFSSGELNLRVLNSQFLLNGQTTPGIAGVSTNAATGGTSRTLFYNTTSNGNDGDGFSFNATGGAYMSARLDTVTSRFNSGYGVNFNATGAGDAILISEGVNVVNTNLLGNYNLNYTNVTNAVASLSGSSNNSAGDGFRVNMTNVTGAALVTIDGNGNGTINGNTNHGINININGADQAGVRIQGYQSISSNGSVAGDDGIHIDLQNITTATAVDVIGVTGSGTTMADNLDDGIDINLAAAALGTFNAPVAMTSASVLTRTDSVALPNESDPPLLALPVPVNIDLGTVAPYPVGNGILIDSVAINSPTDIGDTSVNGILITGNGVTGLGDIIVQNSSVDDSLGNGIHTKLTDSAINDALFINNDVAGNLAGHGIWFEMDGGALGRVAVTDGAILGNAGYGVWIDLDTVAASGVDDPQVIVDGNDIRNNTGLGALGSGVAIHFTDTPLSLVQVSNNTNISGNFGDGVQIFGTNSPVELLAVSGNSNISSNSINGVNIGMVDSNVVDLLIQDNVVDSTPPPSSSNFDITLNLTGMTPGQIAVFQQAAQRWAQAIIGDLPDVGTIDDVLIDGSIVAIDGVGGILGQAGPTAVRGGTFLPYTGVMQFDSADVAALEAAGQFDEVILHEMGHVLGFGTIWSLQGLLTGSGTIDPRFIGTNAVAAYNSRFSTSATGVPVENTGGPGTANSHWRESVFTNELMTGYLNGGVSNPLSAITIAQFADLGYTVNLAAADAYLTEAPSVTLPDMEITRAPITIGPASLVAPGRIVSSLASLASNQQNGINVNLDNSDVTRLQILRNQAYDNGLNGILVTSVDSDHEEVHFIGNTVTGSLGGDGIQLALDNSNITTVLNFENNLVGGSFANGINLQAINASTIADMQVTGNLLGGGGGGGGGTGLDDTLPVIRNGFNSSNLPANDDNSTGLTALGFGVNFFGTTYNSAYLNNNGNITFNAPLFTYTPFSLLSTNTPIIAPFFADVDTRGGSQLMEYGSGTVGGRNAFGVTWDGVRFFQATNPGNATTENQFQLVLVDRSDIAPGDFDFEFNYEQILWESGQASGGDANGLGGSSARVGYSNGVNTAFEMPGSAVNGAFLDGGPSATSLIQNSLNSNQPGRYVFFARGGNIGQVTSNGGDGFNIDLDGLSNINNTNFESNTITSNGVHGIDINVTSGNLGPILLTGNTIADHAGGDGINIIQPNDTDGQLDVTLVGNTITNNTGGRGINIELPNAAQLATTLNLSFTNDAISGNGQEGVRLDLTGNNNGLANNVTANVLVNSSLTDPNAFSGATSSRFNNNGGAGFSIQADGLSDYTLGVGGTGTQNQFNNNGGPGLRIVQSGSSAGVVSIADATFNTNVDAGVGLRLSGASDAMVNMTRTTMNGTTNGADVDFNGEGFMTILRGSSVIHDSSISASTITGNASDGIRFDARGNSLGIFTEVNDFTIGGATAALGNTITGNTGNGISVLRTADAEINNMQILRNTVTDNTNGLYILAANANKLDTYTANFNSFSSNRQNGVMIDQRADADVRVDMDQNLITTNGANGVLLVEQVNTSADSRSLTGNWTRNTITSNSLDGVLLAGAVNNLVIGSAVNPLLGNDISLNAASGVHLTGGTYAGGLTIGNNLIEANGRLSDLGTANEDAGVLIQIASFGNVTVIDNDIVNNNGDGIQASTGAGFNNGVWDLTVQGNDVSNNAGRGIDLLNRGNTSMDATITGNTVNSNGLEGVYIVNTSSTTQNQFASSTTALAADGSVFADPVLRLLFSNNEVRANGLNSPASTTGLYLRVGTSDGGRGSGDTGGFASAGGFTVNPFVGSSRGGVIASVFSNNFGGNFGDDIKFASFVSTVDPATSAGTWGATTDPAAITTFQSDPLARLDLYFNTNTYDSVDVNNSTGVSTGQQTNVAFYNNAEGTFKSRLNSANAPFQGPFTSATRRRNAQRQADFFPPPNNTPSGSSYLYSGVGASTFRVNTTDFNFIVDDTFPYAGFFLPGTITGESAYSWGTLP